MVDESPLARVQRASAQFLACEHGLSPQTLSSYLPIVRQFLTERFSDAAVELEALCPQDAHHFVLRHARRGSRSRAQLTVTALRSFFRFLYRRGEITDEEQDVIDKILAHLHKKEQADPALPLLTPPSRAPPETLALFPGKDSGPTALDQQGRQ
nr:site-specific integrase [Kineobactrum salinum]